MFLKIAIKTFLLDSALKNLFNGITKAFHKTKWLTIDDIKVGDKFSKIYRGDCYHYNCRILSIRIRQTATLLRVETIKDRRIYQGTFSIPHQYRHKILFYP